MAIAEDRPVASGLRVALLEAGLLIATGEDGLYLRDDRFERIVVGIDHLVGAAAAPDVDATYFLPPVMPQDVLVRTGYLRSFPQLAGLVATWPGRPSDHGALIRRLEDGTDVTQEFVDHALALCSAGCHPLYPVLSGRLPRGGRTIEAYGQCFRREPSLDPARLQTFRQHEVVRIGSATSARSHRDHWVERALEIHRGLGLEVEAVVANDPFFGRAGALLASEQRDQALKLEIVTPIASAEEPTAITSANCHLDHFGEAFSIATADGVVAHSSCIGFGVERIALALLAQHGLDPGRWPQTVRDRLGLSERNP